MSKLRGLPTCGFTIIELLVTITILIILMTTSIPAYLKFNKTQTMDTDSRNLISEIERVRSLSSNLVYPSGCVSLLGYNLKSDAALTGVVVRALCTPANIDSPVLSVIKSSVFSASFDLTFLPGTGFLSSGLNTNITIKNNDDPTTTKTITVGAYNFSIKN